MNVSTTTTQRSTKTKSAIPHPSEDAAYSSLFECQRHRVTPLSDFVTKSDRICTGSGENHTKSGHSGQRHHQQQQYVKNQRFKGNPFSENFMAIDGPITDNFGGEGS